MTNPQSQVQVQPSPFTPAPLAHEFAAVDPMVANFTRLLQQDAYRLRLEPQEPETAWELAERCARIRFCGVKSADDAYMRILLGRAIGIPAMASIQGIALFENKKGDLMPCMYAKLKIALLLSRNDIIEYIRPDDQNDGKQAVWRAKRKGQAEQVYRFTWEDALVAGLVGRGTGPNAEKNNYDRHPAPMLSARASGRLADIVGGDILNAIATREDLEEENERPDVPATPTSPPAGAVPARDWGKEADEIKSLISQAVASKSNDQVKAARKAMAKFQEEAPAEFFEAVQTFYSMAIPKKPKPEQAAGSATATASPGTSSSTSVMPTTTPAKPQAEYLPPEKRGDSYEGPDQPPIPFG